MKIRPLHDRVVVRRSEEETKTAGGIVLPGSAAEKPNTGVIVAVGTGRLQDNGEVRALAVKEGDKVVFGPYSGNNTIKVDGEDLLIMKESDILGIIADAAADGLIQRHQPAGEAEAAEPLAEWERELLEQGAPVVTDVAEVETIATESEADAAGAAAHEAVAGDAETVAADTDADAVAESK